jgi:hypothetical protein
MDMSLNLRNIYIDMDAEERLNLEQMSQEHRAYLAELDGEKRQIYMNMDEGERDILSTFSAAEKEFALKLKARAQKRSVGMALGQRQAFQGLSESQRETTLGMPMSQALRVLDTTPHAARVALLELGDPLRGHVLALSPAQQAAIMKLIEVDRENMLAILDKLGADLATYVDAVCTLTAEMRKLAAQKSAEALREYLSMTHLQREHLHAKPKEEIETVDPASKADADEAAAAAKRSRAERKRISKQQIFGRLQHNSEKVAKDARQHLLEQEDARHRQEQEEELIRVEEEERRKKVALAKADAARMQQIKIAEDRAKVAHERAVLAKDMLDSAEKRRQDSLVSQAERRRKTLDARNQRQAKFEEDLRSKREAMKSDRRGSRTNARDVEEMLSRRRSSFAARETDREMTEFRLRQQVRKVSVGRETKSIDEQKSNRRQSMLLEKEKELEEMDRALRDHETPHPQPSLSEERIKAMETETLKSELAKRNLETSGIRRALINRLIDAVETEQEAAIQARDSDDSPRMYHGVYVDI